MTKMLLGCKTLLIVSLLTAVSETAWIKTIENSVKKGVSETENIAETAIDGVEEGFKATKNFVIDGTSKTKAVVKDLKLESHYCECKRHTCQCCATVVDEHFGLNDTICVNAGYNLAQLGVSANITWDGKVIISEVLSASNPPPLCADVPIPKLQNILKVCFRLHDIEWSRSSFRSCFGVSLTVAFMDVYSFELGCVEFGSKDWNWVCGYSHGNPSTPKEARHSCISTCDGFLHYHNATSVVSSRETESAPIPASVVQKRYRRVNGQCEFKAATSDAKKLCILGCTPSSYEVQVF